MVAVVEVQPVDVVVYGVEDLDLHPGAGQCLHLLIGQPQHTAKVVEYELDLHALPAFAAQYVGQPIPYLTLGYNEILQKDEPLRVFQVVQHGVQIRFSGGQIFHRGVSVNRKAFTVQSCRSRIPTGHSLPQPLQLRLGLLLLGQRFFRPGQLFQVQPLGLPRTVPQQV